MGENDSNNNSLKNKEGKEKEDREKRKAAVLVPFLNLPSVGLSLLFTLRSSTVGSHKGQGSFPGGHIDLEKKETAIEAAIREFHEEVDIQGQLRGEESIKIFGVCQEVPAITGTMVTPVLAFINSPNRYPKCVNSAEVCTLGDFGSLKENKDEGSPENAKEMISFATSLIDMYELNHHFPVLDSNKVQKPSSSSFSLSSKNSVKCNVNTSEVDQVFIVPIQDLLLIGRRGEEELSGFKGSKMAYFSGGNYIPKGSRIWGLTGFLVDMVLTMLL